MIANPPARRQPNTEPRLAEPGPIARQAVTTPSDGEWLPGGAAYAVLGARVVLGLLASLLFAAAVTFWLALPGWVVLVLAGLWLLRCAARRAGYRSRVGRRPGSAVERRHR